MICGWIAEPLAWDRWPEAAALLEPARARGKLPCLMDDNELLFAVLDGDDLLACATARVTVEKVCEVILVGGRDHRRWLAELDATIGEAAKSAGATCLRAFGRKGWRKTLGWNVIGEENGFTAYERVLGGGSNFQEN